MTHAFLEDVEFGKSPFDTMSQTSDLLSCATIEDALYIEPKLKILELLFETLPNHTQAGEIKGKLVDALIDNHRIKDSLQNGIRL